MNDSEGEHSKMACSPFFFRKQKQVYFCLWVLSTFFRKFINLIHVKISRELYPPHIHKDASYPCIFYNPIES